MIQDFFLLTLKFPSDLHPSQYLVHGMKKLGKILTLLSTGAIKYSLIDITKLGKLDNVDLFIEDLIKAQKPEDMVFGSVNDS